MISEKFSLSQYSISSILGLIQAEEFVIPEIQRPFVWKRSQVRDLIDSLYHGYPTGYIITWKNPDVKTKDGGVSNGKKVLIDGQQRVTALMASLVGKEVMDEDFKMDRIKIAYNPFAEDDSKRFAVQDASHLKNKIWIPDIAEVFSPTFNVFEFVSEYKENNPDCNPKDVSNAIDRLKSVSNRMIGVIELDQSLDIDEVTEIFIRINSKGTVLNQSDFVMSKMAADEIYGGNILRKLVDYFAHLAVKPQYYDHIESHDEDFVNTGYLKHIAWLRDDNETVYDPGCDDIIRVAFMHIFKRARLAELVQLLTGRDFETRDFREEIKEQTFKGMYEGVSNFVNEYNFKQFMQTIRGAGFISPKMITSNMALDFAYALFLMLQDSDEPVADRKRIVQKWYILSILTQRYSGSPESAFAKDLKVIGEVGIRQALKNIEDATLSDNFWSVALVQNLSYASSLNPTYLTFLAAQIYNAEKSLLSQNIRVSELVTLGGDVHHIFPKKYLIDHGFDRTAYNQTANYAYLDTPVNISIGKKAPKDYFSIALQQCGKEKAVCGSIMSEVELYSNIAINCIPEDIFEMDYTRYMEFLEKRRVLMAKKIRSYYESL
jgi:hypothetical protein